MTSNVNSTPLNNLQNYAAALRRQQIKQVVKDKNVSDTQKQQKENPLDGGISWYCEKKKKILGPPNH